MTPEEKIAQGLVQQAKDPELTDALDYATEGTALPITTLGKRLVILERLYSKGFKIVQIPKPKK